MEVVRRQRRRSQARSGSSQAVVAQPGIGSGIQAPSRLGPAMQGNENWEPLARSNPARDHDHGFRPSEPLGFAIEPSNVEGGVRVEKGAWRRRRCRCWTVRVARNFGGLSRSQFADLVSTTCSQPRDQRAEERSPGDSPHPITRAVEGSLPKRPARGRPAQDRSRAVRVGSPSRRRADRGRASPRGARSPRSP